VPQGDAAAREPVVGGVVVGRGEQARLDRLAAELGQLERTCRLQLHLAFDRLANRHGASLGTAVVKKR
jgi:hypothetical protein